MSMNRVTIMGRLTSDPDFRTLTCGISNASFTLAVERDHSSKEDGSRESDFLDVVAWRSTADFAAKYLAKGRMVAVDGRLQIRNWEDKNGNKRKSVEIIAERIYFADSKRAEERPAQTTHAQAEPADYAVVTEADDELPF